MRLFWVTLIAVSLIGAGCNSTGKKPPNNNTSRPKDRAQDSNPFWAENPSALPRNGTALGDRPIASAEYSGILAGTVVDSSNRPLPGVVVNFTEANASPGSAAKGIETDPQGIFIIKGLKPDVMYMLTFRAEDQGQVLGGSAQAKPPNSHMLIRVTAGNVNALTPPGQANPGATNPNSPKDAPKDPHKDSAKDPPPAKMQPPLEPVPPAAKDPLTEGEDYGPGKTPPASRSFPPPPASKPVPSNNNVAIDPTNPPAPALIIPGPGSSAPTPPKYLEPSSPGSPAMSAEPVPSSGIAQATAPLVAPGPRPKTRLDFTLYDLSGRPWNFRNHSGKLMLLDFWSTSCAPCLRAIPTVVELQSRYRQDGLEVIGIACEEPNRFIDQVAAVEGVKVRFAESKYPVNYRMYLEGTNFEGRVQKQFSVLRYPTMILLDEYGRQLWRSDRQETTKLEDAIKYYLSK